MKRFLAQVLMVLGIWLIVSPWFIGYTDITLQAHDAIIGALIATAAIWTFMSKEKLTPTKPFWFCAALGLYLIVSRILFPGASLSASLINGIAAGAIAILLSLVALQIIEGQLVHIYTKEGVDLVEMTKMTLKDGEIEIKGKAFGAMPQVMRVRPVQLWLLLGLVPSNVLRALPGMLFRGWRSSKKL